MEHRITLNPYSPLERGIRLQSFTQLINLEQQISGSNAEFLELLKTFVNIRSVQEKTAFLQQPNSFLSYELILYTVFNDYDYFFEHIKPHLYGRSEDLIIDTWLCYFSESVKNADFRPPESYWQKIQRYLERYTVKAASYNGVEIMLLMHMLSFFRDVDSLVGHLRQQYVATSSHGEQTFKKLNQLLSNVELTANEEDDSSDGSSDDSYDAESMSGAPAPAPAYHVETGNVVQRDAVYEEIYYYDTNCVFSDSLDFRFDFLLQFLQRLRTGRPLENPAVVFEMLVCGSDVEQRFALALCPAAVYRDTLLQKDRLAAGGFVVCEVRRAGQRGQELGVSVRCPHCKKAAGRLGTLEVQASITNNTVNVEQVGLCVVFPQNCYNLLGGGEVVQQLYIQPYQQLKQRFHYKFVAAGPVERRFQVQVIRNGAVICQATEEDTVPDSSDYRQLVGRQRMSQQDLAVYLSFASESEQVRALSRVVNERLYGLLRGDNAYLDYILQFVISTRKLPADVFLKLLGLISVLNKDYANRGSVDAMLRARLLSGEKRPAAGLGRMERWAGLASYLCGLRLEEFEMYELLEQLIMEDQYLLADHIISYYNGGGGVVSRNKLELYKCYVKLALGDTTAFVDGFPAIEQQEPLEPDDKRIYEQLEKYYREIAHNEVQFEQEVNPVLRDNRYIVLDQQGGEEVTINFHKLNVVFIDKRRSINNLLPHYSFATTEKQIDLHQISALNSGYFLIRVCDKKDETLRTFYYKKKKINVALNQKSGILRITEHQELKYYIHVRQGAQFYKDGFADVNGYFDYYTVSDKPVQNHGTYRITIVCENGDCDIIESVKAGTDEFLERDK